ncbi:hypothetical protein BD769DRAFT_1458367 [Suillus cothurnatus]|nr:hypothetical protein BD769DRAFT_1458367 [Suillus cothurnatus]
MSPTTSGSPPLIAENADPNHEQLHTRGCGRSRATIMEPVWKSWSRGGAPRKEQCFCQSLKMNRRPHYKRPHDINADPSKHFSQLVTELLRQHSSLLFQLRIGHTSLNKHLHCITKVPISLTR